MNATVLKSNDGAEIATLVLPTHAQHCFTVHAPADMRRMLNSAAGTREATLLSQFVFGGNRHYEAFASESSQGDHLPVWLQGDACKDGDMYSMQAVAISGVSAKTVTQGGRTLGATYEDEHARYCRLSGIMPADVSASRSDQVTSAFQVVHDVLAENGFAFTDTIRTWIYLDRLLDWYDVFNRARTALFEAAGIFQSMVPASTGIGASNPSGAAIIMDVLAVQPKDGRMTIQAVSSPLQNPALDYKSSFSRAVELVTPDYRSLLISGTASIDINGRSVHQADAEMQIRQTMEVLNALLASRGMNWGDLFRGIAYFKDMAFLPVYRRVEAELGIPRFPLAISHADVCRDDLLFEIEVDAVKASIPPGGTGPTPSATL